MTELKHETGDLLAADLPAIAHGCNLQGVRTVIVDGDAKMRVCRYKLDVVTEEDRTLMYAGDLDRTARAVTTAPAPVAPAQKSVPAKRAGSRPKKVAKKKVAEPRYYEDCNRKHFAALPVSELRWLGREWGIVGASRLPVPALLDALVKTAAKRRREIASKKRSK